MDYPLIIDGIDAGTLSVSEEGLYTCFEARAGERDGLVRLWVCGGGECAYLGVMQPWSGGLYLRRRLSRSELKGFPAQIEYAADQGGESLQKVLLQSQILSLLFLHRVYITQKVLQALPARSRLISRWMHRHCNGSPGATELSSPSTG